MNSPRPQSVESIPHDVSPEEIRIRLRHPPGNPELKAVCDAVLKDGPQTYRIATIFQIVNGATQDHHHYSLRIRTFDRTKRNGWKEKPTYQVTLENRDPDEFSRLVALLRTLSDHRLPQDDGEYQIIDAAAYSELQDLQSVARRADTPEKVELLRLLLGSLDAAAISGEEWVSLLTGGAPKVLRSIATASRMIEYEDQYQELRRLVEDPDTVEPKLQRLLERNPWMFGSEYSERLDRRIWFRDSQLDFMMRRSSDGFTEIIEIKRPFQENLFIHDTSHDCYRPSADLAEVLGQVIYYIGELDRSRDSIAHHDEVDPLKVRARIIIGRDGDKHQQEALRNLNGHLHRVEVMTFDHLCRIANCVLTVFEKEARAL